MRSPIACDETAPACSSDEIRAELQSILSSRQFARARRCCALLSYLIKCALEGRIRDLIEYEIGISVFRRSKPGYDPRDDPIVRVQAGRLRSRLERYYLDEGLHNPLRITIPCGGYTPHVTRFEPHSLQQRPRLAFVPLSCLNQEAQSFTLGLNEELGFRLYRDFAAHLREPLPDTRVPAGTGSNLYYQFEGSVRCDERRVRVALRLRDATNNHLIWIEQLDHACDASIASQEQLADVCHAALRKQLWLP